MFLESWYFYISDCVSSLLSRWKKPAAIAAVLPKHQSREFTESTGRFYFREKILDQLDDYWVCLRRLKRAYPDKYDFFGRVGCTLLSSKGMISTRLHEEVWCNGHPRFALGAISFCGHTEERENWIGSKILCFEKVTLPPARVQRAKGDIYEMVALATNTSKAHDTKIGIPLVCYVVVDADGNVKLLREKSVRYPKLLSKTHRKGKNGSFDFPQTVWDYPSWTRDGAKIDHHTDPQTWMSNCFALTVNAFHQANGDIRIRCEKDGLVGSFCIDMLRTPYFFKDRDVRLNEKGSRKRIFHIVRTHERMGKFVKTHFRGERDFMWYGYRITITVPGLHHRDILDMDFGSYDAERVGPKGMVSHKAFAKQVDGQITGSVH